MKYFVFITIAILLGSLSSCRYLDGGLIFLQSHDCMSAIKNKKELCTLEYEETLVNLRFTPAPYKKGASYNIEILNENIISAQAELIGLSMEMPKTVFKFSTNKLSPLQVRVSPGLCRETKMLWRLKITLVSNKQETYYTFIDYQIGR